MIDPRRPAMATARAATQSLVPALSALTLLAALLLALPLQAADRDKVRAFAEVTGYDVMIESLQQSAMSRPAAGGDAPDAFGPQYSALAKDVFDPDLMTKRAYDILAAVLPDDLLAYGADFYASDVGQRLVAAENAAHMTDSKLRHTEGQALIEDMMVSNPKRLKMLEGMDDAIGSEETAQKAAVEIQVRFLMAAMAVGASDINMSERELRAALTRAVKDRAGETRAYGLMSQAWTYRDISDADLDTYVTALETPEMRKLYEVLNAVQYQVMVERYEALGARLGELQPQEDL